MPSGTAIANNSASLKNGESTKTCAAFPDNEAAYDRMACNALLDSPYDNNSFCRRESRKITSSKTIIPVYNNRNNEENNAHPKYINEEDVPLLLISKETAENCTKHTIIQNVECKKSETICEFYTDHDDVNMTKENISIDNTNIRRTTMNNLSSSVSFENVKTNELDKSTKSFSGPDHISKYPLGCSEISSNNTEQIKVFQNQACQTEARPKRHVNFKRLTIDQSVTPTPTIRNRIPLNLLTKAISKRREDRRRSKSERKLREVENDTGDVEVDNNKRGQSMMAKEKKHVSLEAKRERKAAKTLAIVTGAFIACWLPFFILALIMPIFKEFEGLKDFEFNQHVIAFFLWMGYFNSTLNPMIYTIFSPEFRQAFQRILCGKRAAQNHRPRHLQ